MRALRSSFTALLLIAVSAGAFAFTMEPMSCLLSPSGRGSVGSFRITNDGKERVAIRFRALTREIGIDGAEKNAPADELFVIYPARLVVEPGATAAAKVQWKGPARLDSELSFRLVAEQVALEAAPSATANSGIKVMFRYVASLYVGEDRFAPSLVANVSGALGPNGEPGYLVEIRNEGTRHVIAANARLPFSGEGALALSSGELAELSGANYLPGTLRRLFVPRPEAVAGARYEARVEYESVY